MITFENKMLKFPKINMKQKIKPRVRQTEGNQEEEEILGRNGKKSRKLDLHVYFLPKTCS